MMSFCAKSQDSTKKPTLTNEQRKELNWLSKQADINVVLRKEVARYKGVIFKQEEEHKQEIANLVEENKKQRDYADSTKASFQRKEVVYISEIKESQKQVKKHKRGKTFWKIAAMLAGGWGVYQSVK